MNVSTISCAKILLTLAIHIMYLSTVYLAEEKKDNLPQGQAAAEEPAHGVNFKTQEELKEFMKAAESVFDTITETFPVNTMGAFNEFGQSYLDAHQESPSNSIETFQNFYKNYDLNNLKDHVQDNDGHSVAFFEELKKNEVVLKLVPDIEKHLHLILCCSDLTPGQSREFIEANAEEENCQTERVAVCMELTYNGIIGYMLAHPDNVYKIVFVMSGVAGGSDYDPNTKPFDERYKTSNHVLKHRYALDRDVIESNDPKYDFRYILLYLNDPETKEIVRPIMYYIKRKMPTELAMKITMKRDLLDQHIVVVSHKKSGKISASVDFLPQDEKTINPIVHMMLLNEEGEPERDTFKLNELQCEGPHHNLQPNWNYGLLTSMKASAGKLCGSRCVSDPSSTDPDKVPQDSLGHCSRKDCHKIVSKLLAVEKILWPDDKNKPAGGIVQLLLQAKKIFQRKEVVEDFQTRQKAEEEIEEEKMAAKKRAAKEKAKQEKADRKKAEEAEGKTTLIEGIAKRLPFAKHKSKSSNSAGAPNLELANPQESADGQGSAVVQGATK